MDVQPAAEQPRQVRQATNLLWGFLALGGIFLGIDFDYAGLRDPRVLAGELGRALGFVSIGVFIFYVSRGRDLARTMILALSLIGALPLLFHVLGQFGRSTLAGLVSLIQVLMLPVALYLLYSKPGNDFFKAKPVASATETSTAVVTNTPTLLPAGLSGWAVAAGYLGVASLLMAPGPFAVLAGMMAMRDIKRNSGLRGSGRAIFGIVMGALGTLILVVAVLMQPDQ